eukprot:gene3815-2701_t
MWCSVVSKPHNNNQRRKRLTEGEGERERGREDRNRKMVHSHLNRVQSRVGWLQLNAIQVVNCCVYNGLCSTISMINCFLSFFFLFVRMFFLLFSPFLSSPYEDKKGNHVRCLILSFLIETILHREYPFLSFSLNTSFLMSNLKKIKVNTPPTPENAKQQQQNRVQPLRQLLQFSIAVLLLLLLFIFIGKHTVL